MPWVASDALSHTKKANTAKKQRQWAAVANNTRAACIKKAGDSITDEQRKKCEASAIQQANAAIGEEASPMFEKLREIIRSRLELAFGAGVKRQAGTWTDEKSDRLLGEWEHDLLTAVDEIESEVMALEPAEADTKVLKTVGGSKYPASDFLVVEDPKKVDTWHLQVKKNGTPDHGLMGAAKAALTSPGGHRGNTYEGPDKDAAIKKLKALYKSEKLPWDAKSKQEMFFTEFLDEIQGDLRDKARQIEMAFEAYFFPESIWRDGVPARYITYSVFEADTTMGDSIIVLDRDEGKRYACGYTREDKGIKFQPRNEWREVVLTYQFVGSAEGGLVFPRPSGESAAAEANLLEIEFAEGGDVPGMVITGHALGIAEQGDVAQGGDKPLILNVIPISPGWGNTRDNNYYSEDAITGAADLLAKVKMYETNHVDAETNNRNWVSTILNTPEYTEAHEPVSRVGVHDPVFAQKVLNLAALSETTGENMLEMLECSIRGTGRAKKGDFEQDGRKGRFIEALTEITNVDWVSKAGARGRAVGLAETEGGIDMKDQDKGQEQGQQETTPDGKAQATEQVPVGEQTQPSPQGQPSAAAAPGNESLTEAQVTEALDGIALPKHTKGLLALGTYATMDELQAKIAEVSGEFKVSTGSGKPVATRTTAAPAVPGVPTQEERNAAISRENRQALGLRERAPRPQQ